MSDQNSDVTALLTTYSAAAYAKDVDLFMTSYADDVRVFDLWGSWLITGAATWRESIAGWFGSLGDERVIVDFEDIEIAVGGDLAALNGLVQYSAESTSGERLRQMTNRITWTLARRNGAWLITHEHTSAPVDEATGKVILSHSTAPR
ncbi:YybH family protein [Lacisediminihabitans changchengi]|uniref:Nuclear transport factor 2 family protein n=1 Tax=Lacisediminihabitans changchengi TaxID=2787634 RepID=A0A934SVW2_9MICO|nr:nuclear transport factor 2 family protein [Lacisediminihabitans changchengi]MBK4348974.1 nuclear transport factor 2 family protein [Lacisediminihabitans changchengi]